MLIINIEDCRIAFGCPDGGTGFDHNKIQKDFLAFFLMFSLKQYICTTK